ncbi:MAG: cystathionine gamma-synthase [Alphaproteobacteria bacterium]
MSKRRRTAIIQAGIGEDPAHHAVISPLYLSSTFEIGGIGDAPEFQYSRTANPTRDLLARTMNELEGGAGAVVTSSGMAAITLFLHLLNPDDVLFAPYDCYGRAYRLLVTLADKGHFRLKFIDQYDKGAVEAAFAADTPKMVFIESPSNPVMRIADIADIAARAKVVGAVTVVDNTFLSPMLQQPLALGADIVMHSTTKFLNGHSDVVGGCVVTNDTDILEQLEFWANSLGVIGAPFDSYMTLRGMRTLELRVHRAQENTEELVKLLHNHESVETVYYPGLPSHTGHDVAKAQQEGFGAMLSFTLKGGLPAVKRFVDALHVFRLAQSLGGTESLINHPASMTHVSMGEEAREKAGVVDGLLRLSIGVEHIDDLTDDLQAALQAAG